MYKNDLEAELVGLNVLQQSPKIAWTWIGQWDVVAWTLDVIQL